MRHRFSRVLKNGNWRDRARKFDHFAMVSLIAAALSHCALMAFSQHPLDASFEKAHYARICAYLCIPFGLLNSMRYAFKQAFHGNRRFREAVETLGEEFGLVLSGAEREDAVRIVDEVRQSFSKMEFQAGQQSFSVTFSVRISLYSAYQSVTDLSDAVDRALSEAKHAGRYRVVVADGEVILERVKGVEPSS